MAPPAPPSSGDFDPHLELATMRRDRRAHSVAIVQPVHPRPPPPAVRQNPLRPSAAVPRESLNRPQTTIRFKEPDFKEARARRLSSATTAAGTAGPSTPKRTDSFIPPPGKSTPSTQIRTPIRRKSTAASLFGTRSWSIFFDPRIRATGAEDPSDTPARNSSEAESGVNHVDGEGKHRSFMKRCKSDRLLHFVLAMVIIVGSGLIISGVVWSETHQSRVMEDKRDFVCGEGIAGGPKCRVHLKGEKSGMGSADWVGGEVVDWWLKNHCVWRGKEGEWWCGSEIGQKEGDEDQVLPDGTWLEKVEDSDDEGLSGPG